jgi:hypothetical protein
MGFLDRFRRKKEDEPSRVARLLQTGRIVEGTILDVITDSDDKVTQVFYCYHVSGVEYESSQAIGVEQQKNKTRYIPGGLALVRYDPRQPANSIVV